jgi:hypothetical protein
MTRSRRDTRLSLFDTHPKDHTCRWYKRIGMGPASDRVSILRRSFGPWVVRCQQSVSAPLDALGYRKSTR